jgi:recyclin-1
MIRRGLVLMVSIYEFIQRRSDWKKIEKTVDKAMYALSVRDDCVIM